MVIMPDGAKFKMNWKYITYVNHGNSIHFSIVPMYNGPAIVLFPNMENWEKDGAFSLEGGGKTREAARRSAPRARRPAAIPPIYHF